MNCRHVNKFIRSKINFKCISTHPQVKPEQIYSCFQKNPKENLRSLKFVPKKQGPKISAEIYHHSEQQAMISKRIFSLQNPQPWKTGDTSLLTTRLQSLMQQSQPSQMNFSTNRIMKSRNVRSVSKHNIGSSASFTHSGFIRKPNTLLKKFTLSYAGSVPKRFGSTAPKRVGDKSTGTSSKPETSTSNSRSEEVPFLATLGKEANSHVERGKTAAHLTSDAKRKPTLFKNEFKSRMEDLSMRIRDDLMKIDGSLKQKIALTKANFKRGIAQNCQNEEPNTNAPKNAEKPLYPANFDLMPMIGKRSTLDALNEHWTTLDLDQKSSILGKSFNPSAMARIRRDMTTVDSLGDGRLYSRQLIEPFQVKWGLMAIQQECTNMASQRHIVDVSSKNKADANGVYFVPRCRKICSV